ncbi:TIGR02302 family protein [Allostella vacuolata]|nr:TIGR02302 family protein [Stella vacuolata]
MWPALWPPAGAGGLFLALALLDLPSRLPAWLHVAVLAGFAAGFLFLLARAVRAIAMPADDDARRRVERASGLDHRPLGTLQDRPAATLDPQEAQLWAIHQERMRARTRQLAVGVPAAGWGRRDVAGLRAALALLLVIGVVAARHDGGSRLWRAVTPSFAATGPAATVSLDVWINPPAYTAQPPVLLRADSETPVPIPTGSALLAQLHGGGATPRLLVDEAATEFSAIDAANFRAGATLTQGERLSVLQGSRTVAAWPIRIVPDLAPTVSFAAPPARSERAALRLEYQAGDDYGIESVTAFIRRADEKKDGAKTEGGKAVEPITLELPLPGLKPTEARSASFHDLTAHVWAGLPVVVTLEAVDAIGQKGRSEPIATVLPERTFTHPVARALVEQRRELSIDPANREAVAEVLGTLSLRPARFGEDLVVFLALRSARARLSFDGDGSSIEPVQQLLWDTALRIEDGRPSTTERDLRQAQRALMDALDRNASDQEIERLMRELQQAIDRHMQAMAEEMMRNPERFQQQEIPPNSQVVRREDIQRMLDQARDLARTGAREAARDMLQRLQEMMENMRMARPMPGQQQQGQQGQAQQMMRDLQRMMQRQQQLLDRSHRAQQQRQGQRGQQGQQGQRGQQGQQGQQGQGDQDGEGMGAGDQEQLRRMLGEFMRRMGEGGGEIPGGLGRAERAMRDAARQLGQGDPGGAVGPQGEALDQLQQAMQGMAEQMMGGDQFGEGDPQGVPNQGQRNADRSRDPLGRPMPTTGTYEGSDVKVPGEGELSRSRAILDELRRRAGERFRPSLERDYIDRLLRRF